MVVLSDGDELTLSDLPEEMTSPTQTLGRVRFELPPEGISLEEVEKEIIKYALSLHQGNQSQTAKFLGITRSALIYRMQKFEMDE
jgi:two-component system NtrC family response regulator